MPINPTTSGQIITGGLPIAGAGTVNPLSVRGVPVDGVNGVASQGTLTIAEPVTDGDTMTIGTVVYRLMDTPVQAYDIEIGANEAATKVNIVAAINQSGTDGVEYFTGTLVHPTVSAAAFATDDCVLTAVDTGVAGDTIVSTETFTHVSNVFDAVTLGTTTAGVTEVGTYKGIIAAGGYVNDFTNEDVYENTGTQALPEYTQMNA